MHVINRIAKPGEIKRVELRPSVVRIVMRDGTERTYVSAVAPSESADPGAMDAVSDRKQD